jgi:hypothetical protein
VGEWGQKLDQNTNQTYKIAVVVMYWVGEGKVGKLALFFSYHSLAKL